jgi:hypothetical protein
MKPSKCVMSFKEFYYIEEGFVDEIKNKKKEILDKWEEIKFYLKQDNQGRPINTKKVHSLKDEIFLLLKRLKDESIDLVKDVILTILKDYNISLRNEKLQTFFRISVWILHVIAVLGLYKFNEMKAARRMLDGTATQAEYQTLKNNSSNETTVTSVIPR